MGAGSKENYCCIEKINKQKGEVQVAYIFGSLTLTLRLV